jgi:CheY-like chemotaxis protein
MAFRKAGVNAKLEVAADGDKAITALSAYPANSLPACVLLDIKLPSKSGLEVLSWIRKNTPTKRLPVVMLTSSLLPGDVNQAYDLGANSYLIKPPNLDSLIELVKTIDSYWLRTNTPPGPCV